MLLELEIQSPRGRGRRGGQIDTKVLLRSYGEIELSRTQHLELIYSVFRISLEEAANS